MNASRAKILIGWLASIFVLVHVSLVFVYALPEELGNNKVKRAASHYVFPIFDQTWSMFAPCPVINAQLEIKFYFENDSTDWIKPTEESRRKHAIFSGTHHGELVLAESNLMYWVNLDMKEMGVEIGEEISENNQGEYYKGYSYKLVKNYIQGNGYYLFNKRVKNARVRCFMENVVTGESGMTELPLFSWKE